MVDFDLGQLRNTEAEICTTPLSAMTRRPLQAIGMQPS
jgi:hypothetical protein